MIIAYSGVSEAQMEQDDRQDPVASQTPFQKWWRQNKITPQQWEFIAGRLALQEILKEVNQAEKGTLISALNLQCTDALLWYR